MLKVVTLEGLSYFLTKIQNIFVAQESGKALSTNDYTDDEKLKLSGIPSAAEENTINTIKINGSALEPSEKTVDIALEDYIPDISSAEIDEIIANIS